MITIIIFICIFKHWMKLIEAMIITILIIIINLNLWDDSKEVTVLRYCAPQVRMRMLCSTLRLCNHSLHLNPHWMTLLMADTSRSQWFHQELTKYWQAPLHHSPVVKWALHVCLFRARGLGQWGDTAERLTPSLSQKQMALNIPHLLVSFSIIEISYS